MSQCISKLTTMLYYPKYNEKRDISPNCPCQSVDLRKAIVSGLVTDMANTQDYGYINPEVDEVGRRVRNVFDAADHLNHLEALSNSIQTSQEV